MANGDRDGEAGGERVAQLYGVLRPHLDERQRRLLLGAEAIRLGRGGIKTVAGATGVHPDTVGRGVREAEGRPEPRVRAPGGGRKKLAKTDPGLGPALMALVEPESRGDPESPLRWTCLSTRNLAGALTAAGHRCSAPTVARLLRAEGYSLQGNAKVAEGAQRHAEQPEQQLFLRVHGAARIAFAWRNLRAVLRDDSFVDASRVSQETAARVASIYWHFMDGLWVFLLLLLTLGR